MKKLKKKKCKACKGLFTPFSSTQTACSPNCAYELATATREKKEAKDLRERKKKLKKRSEWLSEAQKEFNKFIRIRDAALPCISCGRTDGEIKEYLRGGKWDCGHFLTRGAFPELRFEELNAHKQCKSCNGGSGKYTKKNHTVGKDYRVNLIKKIGLEKVEWVEGKHEAKHYTIDDIKEIKAEYKSKIKELE